MEETPVVGLAKREEEIYLPERPEPLRLERSDAALKLLQQVRDEAHRFSITGHHQTRARARKRSRLEEIPGIGPITASALVATIGDARSFKNARQLAAWLGLVPRQHSSGGKPVLLGISKRDDTYLRTLLIHGARAVLRVAERKVGHAQSWLGQVLGRRHKNVAAVALANKNARTVWALLAHGRNYQSDYAPSAV